MGSASMHSNALYSHLTHHGDEKMITLFFRDPLAQFEVEKREHEMKMRKMEQEMEEVFEMKVQEKLQKLKDIEADVSNHVPCSLFSFPK